MPPERNFLNRLLSEAEHKDLTAYIDDLLSCDLKNTLPTQLSHPALVGGHVTGKYWKCLMKQQQIPTEKWPQAHQCAMESTKSCGLPLREKCVRQIQSARDCFRKNNCDTSMDGVIKQREECLYKLQPSIDSCLPKFQTSCDQASIRALKTTRLMGDNTADP